ncbi:MAG: putative rane protein [Frankiales bacterium]|nr:putative rane protein [Frankiales bacterium]
MTTSTLPPPSPADAPPDRPPQRLKSGGSVVRKVSLRNLAAHKVRLALTVLSVVLGTAFIAGSFVFTDTLSHTFKGLLSDVGQGVDVQVTGQEDDSSGVPLADVDRIKTIDGVRAVQPVMSGQIVLIAADGKPTQSGGAPTEGLSYSPPAEQLGQPYEFTEGSPPTASGQIALNQGAMKLAKLQVGDHTKVLAPSTGTVDVTITGVYKTKTDTGGYIGALFAADQARSLFTDGKHIGTVYVAAQPGVSQDQLRARVAQQLPDMKVITGKQLQADTEKDINTALSFINYFLLAFGAIALLVGTFIIYNTFSMLVAQRLRELALLRAIGASRRQISRSVLLEAMLVGLTGSIIGIAAGVGLAYGLRSLLNSFNVGLPSGALQLTPRTIIVALLVGVLVTMFSAYTPARRAARTPPVAAMREEFASTGTSLRRRTAAAVGFGLLGAIALAFGGLAPSGGGAASLVGLGALAMIIAVLLGAPALSRPIVGAVGAVVARPFGAVGRLARTNAVRNPRRTAATAFALTLGLMLVTTIAVFGASAKHSINALVDNNVRADYVLTGPDAIGVPVQAGAVAEKVPGVASSLALSPLDVRINGKSSGGTAVDGPLAQLLPYKLISGRGELSGHNIMVSQTWAKDHKVGPGSSIAMVSSDKRSVTATVSGVYENNELLGPWLGSGDFGREVTPPQFEQNFVVLIKAQPGTNLATLRTNLENATDPFLVVKVQTAEEFKGSQADQINGLLGVLYGLLALAIVIAILGIINTLALSVVERRREIGMLRAVGIMRGQLRRTIYLESLLIAVFGAIVGVAMGLVFGPLFVHTLRDQGLGEISVPWGQAVLLLVLSAVVGVLAALWPAARAARTRPLEAIADL